MVLRGDSLWADAIDSIWEWDEMSLRGREYMIYRKAADYLKSRGEHAPEELIERKDQAGRAWIAEVESIPRARRPKKTAHGLRHPRQGTVEVTVKEIQYAGVPPEDIAIIEMADSWGIDRWSSIPSAGRELLICRWAAARIQEQGGGLPEELIDRMRAAAASLKSQIDWEEHD